MPDNPRELYRLAIQPGEPRRRELLERIIRIDPTFENAWRDLLILNCEKNDLSHALTLIDDVWAIDEDILLSVLAVLPSTWKGRKNPEYLLRVEELLKVVEDRFTEAGDVPASECVGSFRAIATNFRRQQEARIAEWCLDSEPPETPGSG